MMMRLAPPWAMRGGAFLTPVADRVTGIARLETIQVLGHADVDTRSKLYRAYVMSTTFSPFARVFSGLGLNA